jgi:HEAT repeat protein
MSDRDWWEPRKPWGLQAMRANDFPDWDGDTDLLIDGLKDPERRRTAAQWLGELGERKAIPALIRMLDAHDPFARIEAARALGVLEATEAVERLTEIATEDEELFVRRWAAEALGRIADPSSVHVLLGLLSAEDWGMRVSAVYALGLIDDPTTLDAVRNARRRDRWRLRYPLMRPAYRHTVRALKQARLRVS